MVALPQREGGWERGGEGGVSFCCRACSGRLGGACVGVER